MELNTTYIYNGKPYLSIQEIEAIDPSLQLKYSWMEEPLKFYLKQFMCDSCNTKISYTVHPFEIISYLNTCKNCNNNGRKGTITTS